jgi:hypothetical protein
MNEFTNDEVYIIGKSLIDAWGYPYNPKNIKYLAAREVYQKIEERFNKESDYKLLFNDIPLVLNALDLLYYENRDFEALYDGITKEDVKALHNKLKSLLTD